MNILILGGDGYLGWPTAMRLSTQGHRIFVVDNYLRRNLHLQEDVEPLYPVPNLLERTRLWNGVSGNYIKAYIGDLQDWDFISGVFKETQPEVVIHYAEQPSAPFSMLNRNSATLTLQNNLMSTANVIFAVREFSPQAHIIKLGTMGEYGTPNIDIEEGWLDVKHNGREDKFLYPRQAGSLYHTTKIMDTDMLWFYTRMWGIKVTDLMQGPVYGLFTEENQNNGDNLLPFFCYDELFGTVLNRFVTQAVMEYPLTIYGKGGQTRGYLNIKDTINCVQLALDNPPESGELRILNQFTETFSVNCLAEKVQSVAKQLGFKVAVDHISNPRKEQEEHYYNPAHTGLLELGLKPNYLTDEVLAAMLEKVAQYRSSIQIGKIFRGTLWDKNG